MNPALVSLAVQAGTPIIRRVLSSKFGADNVELAENVVGSIASAAGVSSEVLHTMAVTEPEEVKRAMVMAEPEAAEHMALYMEELEAKQAIFAQEAKGPTWTWAWRPAGMYVIFGLVLWNAIVLHTLNAAYKIALPPIPWQTLGQGIALYLSLYMGGHTVKDVAKSWLSGQP